MLHIKKLMGMHNKETYTRVYTCMLWFNFCQWLFFFKPVYFFEPVQFLEYRAFRTNVFSYHLDTRSYHIVYMFVPHKHTFKIAQI